MLLTLAHYTTEFKVLAECAIYVESIRIGLMHALLKTVKYRLRVSLKK